MISIMQAAAQVIARAKDVVSAAGRPCFECQCCKEHDAIVPNKDFQALYEAVDDYYTLSDLEDAAETEASVGADLKRDIARNV